MDGGYDSYRTAPRRQLRTPRWINSPSRPPRLLSGSPCSRRWTAQQSRSSRLHRTTGGADSPGSRCGSGRQESFGGGNQGNVARHPPRAASVTRPPPATISQCRSRSSISKASPCPPRAHRGGRGGGRQARERPAQGIDRRRSVHGRIPRAHHRAARRFERTVTFAIDDDPAMIAER
jgi:hypothetical protein